MLTKRWKEISLVVAVVIVVVGVFFLTKHSKQATAANHKPPVTASVTLPPAVTQPSEPPLPYKLLMFAMVRKGEGPESTVIRQLALEPGLMSGSKKGAYKGNINDKAALTTWAGRQAHRLARKVGWVTNEDGGAELRIKSANTVAFLLKKDANGNLSIEEYKVTDGPGTYFGDAPTPISIYHVADSTSQAKFVGLPASIQQHPLPTYEYIYTG